MLLWDVLWADVGDAPAARGQWLLALCASRQACGRALKLPAPACAPPACADPAAGLLWSSCLLASVLRSP